MRTGTTTSTRSVTAVTKESRKVFLGRKKRHKLRWFALLPLGTNTRAVALFNRSTGSASITVTFADLGISAGAATVRNLWAAQDLGSFADAYTAPDVPSHTVVMLKVVGAP
jgi:hypothetical protein